jgi:hypothetical protein
VKGAIGALLLVSRRSAALEEMGMRHGRCPAAFFHTLSLPIDFKTQNHMEHARVSIARETRITFQKKFNHTL